MARPSKFTPDRRERFLTALAIGVFPETAARYAGWSPATLYRILGGVSPAHVAFRDEVRRVETELELRLAGTVTQAAFQDPRLALAMLERRFGDRWGRRAMVPRLLAARFGSAGSPEALERVGRFAVPHDEPDE